MNDDGHLIKAYTRVKGKLAAIPKEIKEIVLVAVIAYLVAKYILPSFLR